MTSSATRQRGRAHGTVLRHVGGAIALIATLGCHDPAPSVAPASPERGPTQYLDEWFTLGHARCRVAAVERILVEQRSGNGRLPEDVFMVDARWVCEAAGGRAVPVAEVLQKAGAIAWVDDRGVAHARASARPGEPAEGHLRFAVPAERDGLPRPRKYDAVTGAPQGPRELRRARLTVRTAEAEIAIAPFPRLHEPALDRLLDALVRALVTTEPVDALARDERARTSLREARQLVQEARGLFGPQLVALASLSEQEGQPRLVLTLERSHTEESIAKSLRFVFELALVAGSPTVLRLIDPEGMRQRLGCVAARRALLSRIGQRALHGPVCNVSALFLPGSCEEADPDLLAEALRYGGHCGADDAPLTPADPSELPDDFAVRVVRGRPRGALDRTPRYALSVVRSGEVRFVGEHWVRSAAQSTGRAPEAALAALYAHIGRLGYFARPDPERRPSACQGNDQGDVIRVVADGRDRVVRDRDGCRPPFTALELATLRRAIERVAGVDAWTAPAPDGAIRDDQIWVVAAE